MAKKVVFTGKIPKKREKIEEKTEEKPVDKPSGKEDVTIENVTEKISESKDQDQNISDENISTDPKTDDKTIEEATKEFLNPKIFSPLLDSAFSMAANKLGDHWKLQEAEKDQLSEAFCNYMNVVLPEIMKDQPELIALVMTAAIIIVPRGLQSVKEKRKDKKPIPELPIKTGKELTIKPNGKGLSTTSS